jgi:hypothetical protein
MNDRELLELAAKAAGYEAWDWLGKDGLLNVYDANGRHDCWNPLTDDGDAFRLAVKLKLIVDIGHDYADAKDPEHTPEQIVAMEYFGDPDAATRRAIVRVAAEIGREMK